MLFEAHSQFDIREQSVLSLAFVGDSVFELLVRQRAVETTRLPLARLHGLAVGYVSAHRQALGLQAIAPLLTEPEAAVVRRGRNAEKLSVSKHATREEYCASTGLEALFGWLYLRNKNERLLQLFDVLWQALAQAEAGHATEISAAEMAAQDAAGIGHAAQTDVPASAAAQDAPDD